VSTLRAGPAPSARWMTAQGVSSAPLLGGQDLPGSVAGARAQLWQASLSCRYIRVTGVVVLSAARTAASATASGKHSKRKALKVLHKP